MRNSILITLALALFVSCAKERSIEVKPDPQKDRLAKQNFIGVNGERSYWFSKVTVTNTSTDGGFAFVGYQSDLKVGFFEFSRDNLNYYSAVTPDSPTRPLRIFDIEKDANGKIINEVTKNDLINSWSIKHTDTRLGESDGRVTNREEENDYAAWNQKKFFTVDWNKANIGEASSFPYAIDSARLNSCWEKKGSELVPGSREISGDYISFTVAVNYRQISLCSQSFRRHFRQDFTYTVHYKYSFRRVLEKDLSGYKPYVYSGMTDPLMKKYGYFQTYVERLNKDNRHEISILMNRWHPDRLHTFYFAPDYPEEYKWIFNDPKHGVFAKTNELLKRNGAKLRFQILDNDGSKKFGDVRYSFIKMINDIDPGSPLGYGPSDANPFTGELISANTMLWSGSLKFYVQLIQDHMDRKLDGGPHDSTIFKGLEETLKESPKQWTSTSNALDPSTVSGKAFRDLLPERTFGYPGWARFSVGSEADSPTLMKLRGYENIKALMSTDADLNSLKTSLDAGHKHIHDLEKNFHVRNTTVYKADQSIADARKMLISGRTPQQVIDTILYNVSIHEFGHNLSLRHNFYGSVDKHNFAKNTVALDRNNQPIAKLDKEGQPMVDKDGKPVHLMTKNSTSSVMEYLALKDEFETSHQWGAYDEAALVYAYTEKHRDLSKEQNKRFLYCTDEHRVTNALCNVWDTGTTPSQIALSMIESYDESYHTSNRRYGRALWDTSGYQSRRFNNMWSMKKFLMLWRSGMNASDVKRLLKNQGHSDEAIEVIYRDFEKDLKQAVKLSIGFYNSVLQQSSSQRHYRSEYDEWTGELERVGIISDKIFAMMFLMGDSTFLYNPNRYLNYASFLSYRDHEELAPLIDKVMENTLTVRVDMEPWFIGYGRTLFALNASNFNNMDDRSLMDKIKVSCYKPESLKKQFGINPNSFVAKAGEPAGILDSAIVEITPEVKASYYAMSQGSKLGIVRINQNYYVAGKSRNPYAFNIIWNMKQQPDRFDNSLASAKDDLMDTYRLYQHITKSQNYGCE